MMNGSGTPNGAASSQATIAVAGPNATTATWAAAFAGSATAYRVAQAAWGRPGVGGSAAGQSLADLLSVPNAIQIAYTLLPVGAISAPTFAGWFGQ